MANWMFLAIPGSLAVVVALLVLLSAMEAWLTGTRASEENSAPAALAPGAPIDTVDDEPHLSPAI